MPVIGTAGHVDHGKSTLIEALTGIDPDRLREEKERGLTIDLGFAWLTLPSGLEVGVVDVPGHERFIKNMLAGAGGMDLALLVVAADEGPRPQTAEHLAILDLLEVPAGIVVLTKCDLVESDYADLVEAELEDVLAGSRMSGAPVVRVSALSGLGLDILRNTIDAVLATLPARRDLARPRLPVDRAFTIQGFGAVVTGTLTDGTLRVGDEMELFPEGLRCRVRGLQRHRTKVDGLGPGTRGAVNLSGVRTEEIHRGMVLARPGSLTSASSLVARLTASRILLHPLSHESEVTLLAATSETQARVRLLEAETLARGADCWAQIVLQSPIALLPGDHVVIRTPDETVAGGPVVAVNGRRLRRSHRPTVEGLERLLAGSPAERLADALVAGPRSMAEIASEFGIPEADATQLAALLVSSGEAQLEERLLIGRTWLRARSDAVVHEVATFLAANPLRRSAPREHVRRAVALDPTAFEIVVSSVVHSAEMETRGAGLAPVGYEPTLSRAQEEEISVFLASIRAEPFSPPTDRLPSAPVLAYLVERGEIETTAGGVVFAAEAFAEMVRRVKAHMADEGSLSLAATRDLFGTSRKYAQAFLEHLDALRITRRNGDLRTLL
jgi:selenocysteine-specific elongation factor